MRTHRFFVDEELSEKGELAVSDPELVNQWKNVFRLAKGDRCVLLDDTGFEYEAEFLLVARGEARLRILSFRAVESAPRRELTLLCSVVKKDNFEWILQKGTELGVARFVPLLSERSEKKSLNMDRARKIAREASEQSGRGTMPELYGIHDLEDALRKFDGQFVAFDPTGPRFYAGDLEAGAVSALIGPEGGWTERELKLFEEKGIPVRSLGSQILRAETAAVAISALLLL